MPCKRWATSHNPSSAGPRYFEQYRKNQRRGSGAYLCLGSLASSILINIESACDMWYTCFHISHVRSWFKQDPVISVCSRSAAPPRPGGRGCRVSGVRGCGRAARLSEWTSGETDPQAQQAQPEPPPPQFQLTESQIPHKTRETHCDDDTRMRHGARKYGFTVSRTRRT